MQLQITRGQSFKNEGSHTPKGLAEHSPLFENTYRHCRTIWEDIWDCGCDDECPKCGADIPPHESAQVRQSGYTVLYRVVESKPTDAPTAYLCFAEDEFDAEGECRSELGEDKVLTVFVANTFDVLAAYQAYQNGQKRTA